MICQIPFRNHSFDISKSNWEGEYQSDLINRVFEGKNTITLNRFDLFNSAWNIEQFIIKTLMWGYPTKGRGNNIETILKDNNFNTLVIILDNYRDSEITAETLIQNANSISGIGVSTISKFIYFLKTRVNGYKSIILDRQIIEVINSGRFEELNPLSGIRYDNALNNYVQYIKTIDEISTDSGCEPDQIELFLFSFGRNLSELKGEGYFDSIDDL